MADFSIATMAMADKKALCYNRGGGDIAQLGERRVRIAEVGGSNPPISTIIGNFPHLGKVVYQFEISDH
jgi:hypothetical protein